MPVNVVQWRVEIDVFDALCDDIDTQQNFLVQVTLLPKKQKVLLLFLFCYYCLCRGI